MLTRNTALYCDGGGGGGGGGSCCDLPFLCKLCKRLFPLYFNLKLRPIALAFDLGIAKMYLS
jgi:hypothetical protein